ncbi:alpha/beta hydrolase [Caldovatus sediminis]|uniref:Alpha/beta hydrolase n=1 Tax=Caldovatus sediminis TaxID=2041189 RepID=A0A8J2ZAN1_9PROT|nr:alpha/beta fold hydrolase [Caldovatus sediminis]GGG31508.1 alpha/beta hydrolase [Caldovatus sediminis]
MPHPTEILPTARGRALLWRPARPAPGAPALLLLHGAAGGAWMWCEGFAARLAEAGWLVAALDLRRRRADGAEASLADYAADARAALAALRRPALLVGHSLGGLLAQRLLAEPAVRGAALLAPVPPEGLWWSSLRLVALDPLLAHGVARMADGGAHGASPAGLGAARAALRAALFHPDLPEATALRHLRRLTRESAVAVLEAQAPQPLLPAALLGRPVLAVARAGDRLIPADTVLRTAAFHGAAATLFDGPGHAMMLDLDWRDIADHLLGWAARQPRLAPAEALVP